jgi:lysophospholipase L1-like esterase
MCFARAAVLGLAAALAAWGCACAEAPPVPPAVPLPPAAAPEAATPAAAPDDTQPKAPDDQDRRAATTPVPRHDNAYVSLHRQYVERAKQGGVNVLFLGDSITQAWSGPGKTVWQKEYAPLGAANFGISADMTQSLLWRLADGELEGLRPRAIVLMIGTNNLKSGPTRMAPEDVAAGVKAVLGLLRDRLPEARVLLLGILPRQPQYPWMAATVRKMNGLLAALADGRRVRFLDFSGRFLKADGTIEPKLMQKDLLHLSPEGYRVWAEAMRPALGELLALPEAGK